MKTYRYPQFSVSHWSLYINPFSLAKTTKIYTHVIMQCKTIPVLLVWTAQLLNKLILHPSFWCLLPRQHSHSNWRHLSCVKLGARSMLVAQAKQTVLGGSGLLPWGPVWWAIWFSAVDRWEIPYTMMEIVCNLWNLAMKWLWVKTMYFCSHQNSSNWLNRSLSIPKSGETAASLRYALQMGYLQVPKLLVLFT